MIRAALPLALLAALPAAHSASAQERTRAFRYAVDWGPAALAELELRVTEGEAETRIAAEARSTGLLSVFSDFEAVQTARHGPQGPEHFLSHGSWGDDQSAREVFFGDGPPRAETIVASTEEDEPRTPIPDGALDAAVDPFHPFLTALAQIEAGGGCDHAADVFTGRSAFRVSLTAMGDEVLEADRDWTYGGAAQRCRIGIERIGGFPLDGGRWRQKEEDVTRDLWIAVLEDGRAAPVRMRVSWPLGYAVGRIVLN